MNKIHDLAEKILNLVSFIAGEDYSTGHEDTLTNYPRLGAHWS